MFDPKCKTSYFFKSVAFVQILTLLVFFTTPPRFAQAQTVSVLNLPVPGTMVTASEKFIPPLVKGLTLHPENPLAFDFIIDSGNAKLTQDELKSESEKLIKYFLATLAIPEEDLWVNLSPYEKSRIVPDGLGQTDMGRDLLAQDYILKQLSASLIYPEKDLGKDFWNRVYKKAKETYGTVDIPVNTFNKVWIVPEKAAILETGKTAYIVDSHMKVMLEADYVALDQNRANEVLGTDRMAQQDVDAVNSISSNIVREIILPEIEREVNEGKNFAPLRQIYNSLILAIWFKNNLQDNLINQVYSNQLKIKGVDLADKTVKEKIYQQYLAAYRKGVFNYIKEDTDLTSGDTIPRKYFSGGFLVGRETAEKIAAQEIDASPGNPEGNTVASLLNSGRVSSRALTPDGSLSNVTWAVTSEGGNRGGISEGFNATGGDRAGSDAAMLALQYQWIESNVSSFQQKHLELGFGKSYQYSNPRFDKSKPVSQENSPSVEGPVFNSLSDLLALTREYPSAGNDRKSEIRSILEGYTNLANAQRMLQKTNDVELYKQMKPAPKVFLSDLSPENSRAAILEAAQNGEIFIELMAGGAADRAKTSLKDLGIKQEDAAYRIWNLKFWDIIKSAKALTQKPTKAEALANLEKVQAVDVPDYAKDYTIGQRLLYAISKGVDDIPNITTEQRNKIRANLKIVVHVNNDIINDVVNDFKQFDFFGLNPDNIILTKGGYGPAYEMSESGLTPRRDVVVQEQVKTEEGEVVSGVKDVEEITWNHLFAFMENKWKVQQNFKLDRNGNLTPITTTVNEHLKANNARYGLLRRVNDAILLEPKAAMDIDFLAAFLQAKQNKNANMVYQVMPNTAKNKGGMAMTLPGMGEFSFPLEGLDSQDPGIQQRLSELSADTPYNRLYAAYDLIEIDDVTDDQELPLSIKVKEYTMKDGTKQLLFSPESPVGNLQLENGVKALAVQRDNDLLFDEGIIKPQRAEGVYDLSNPNHVKGERIHDIKKLEDFTEILVPVYTRMDRNLDIRSFAESLPKVDFAMLSQWNAGFQSAAQKLELNRTFSTQFTENEINFDELRAALSAEENKNHPPSVALRTPAGVFDNTVGAPSKGRWLEVLNNTLQNPNFAKIAQEANVKEWQLPNGVQSLFVRARGGEVLRGQDLTRLNKALLQTIYPLAIRSTSEDPLDWAPADGERVGASYPASEARFNQQFVQTIERALPSISFVNSQQKVSMLTDFFISGTNEQQRNAKGEPINIGARSYLKASEVEDYLRLNYDNDFSAGVGGNEAQFLSEKWEQIGREGVLDGDFSSLQGLSFEGFVKALRDPNDSQLNAVRKIYGLNNEVGSRLADIQRRRDVGEFAQNSDGSFVKPEASNVIAQFKRDMHAYSSLIGFLHNLATSMNRSPAADSATLATDVDENSFDVTAARSRERDRQAERRDGRLKKDLLRNVAQPVDPVGGIDLNPANLKIEINKENGGVNVQYDPQLLQQLREQGIDGFVPYIINMQPITSVLPLLSEANQEERMQLTRL